MENDEIKVKMNMRETRWNEWCAMLVWVLFRCGWAPCVVHEKGLWMTHREWMMTQQERSRKWKNWEKRKEGGKVVWGKRASFYFCVTVSFTPSFSPLNPQCHHSSFYAITHGPTPHHTIQSHHCAVLFMSVWLCVHSIHTQSNNTTSHNHAVTTHDTTNGWCNERMGKSSGDWGHHKHQAPQWSDDGTHFIWSHWLHELGSHTHQNTTPQGQERGEVTRRKKWLEKEGWRKKKDCHFCVLVWHHTNHSPLVFKPKKEQ